MSERSRHVYRTLYVLAPVGVAAGVACAFFAPWEVAVLTGWDVVAGVLLWRVRSLIWNLGADDTARVARVEDPSRGLADVLLIVASVMSIVGVGYTLRLAEQSHGYAEARLTALAAFSLACSWFMVHAVFTLRYAHLYFTGRPGGISFNEDDPPRYSDFAYFAFTVGMTFQVSDTNVESKEIRRTALRHALLAYLFGAVILASVVNVGASLLK